MKKSLIATLIAVPVLSLSSMAFAAEPASTGPVMLSSAQMDGVTAGYYDAAFIFQYNASPVTSTQVSVLNIGGGDNGNNTAFIWSGNVAHVHQ